MDNNEQEYKFNELKIKNTLVTKGEENNEKNKLSQYISVQGESNQNKIYDEQNNQESKKGKEDEFYKPLNGSKNTNQNNIENKSQYINHQYLSNNNQIFPINNSINNENTNKMLNSTSYYLNKEYINNNQNNININNIQNMKSSHNSNNNKEEIQAQFKDMKTFISRYKKAPKTFLQNKGKMSDLNSVIQALGQIKYFAFYFLNPDNIKSINTQIKQKPLSFVTLRFFNHCYPYPEVPRIEAYNLDSYSKVLASLSILYNSLPNKLFNPNDLLTFVLDTLHRELDSNINNQNAYLNYDKYNLKDTIEKNVKNYFNHQTVISKTLNWYQLTESICLSCQNSTFKFISFSTFNFDIAKAYVENFQKGINDINVYDCLNKYQEVSYKNLKCEKCNNSFQKIAEQSKIFSISHHLIFQLDRGLNFDKANTLMNILFSVEKEINLSNYIKNPLAPKHYELTGIVSIFLKEKKYVCYSKSPIDNNWYYYNDENIQYTELKIVLEEHNSIDKYIPCILIYKSITQGDD